MNLSHKLTFSLVFSVFLVAAFAFVPTAMGAEGGPTIVSIVLDDSMTTGTDGPDNDAAMMDDNIPAKNTVSDGKALLTTTGQFEGTTGVLRADLVDTTAASPPDGTFRLIVTFDQDVYNDATARPDAPNDPIETLRDQSASRAIAADDLGNTDFTVLSALGITTGALSGTATITNVTRVQTAGADTTTDTSDDEYHRRQFYVTITVSSASYVDLPINIALVVNQNVIFGIGANRVIAPFRDAQPGLGNVGYNSTTPSESDAGYRQYDFQVIARAVSTLTVAPDLTRAIKSSERVTLTLTFDPALHDSDVPTRTNIEVDGGSILADDPATDDDDGLYEVPPAAGSDPPDPAPNTQWKIVIVPDGGTGVLTRTITVQNKPGAAFTFMETISVDDRTPQTPTPTQGITITGTAPRDGAKFVATITYTIAPAVDLTAAAVSVANGAKDDTTFSKVSDTVYTIEIDPNNPTVDNPVTVTVSVGQFSQGFETTATPTPTPVDPNAPTVITLTVGVDAGDYLVVAPTGAMSTGMANSALPASVSTANGNLAMTADLPNLWSLLFSGGTIAVYVTADADENTADIIINEVMWARNEGAIGQAGEVQHQWIELYNNSAHDAAGGSITLQFRPKVAPDALAAADYGSRTDRLSNIERVGTKTGWRISSGKGQSGNTTEGSLKEFISMYRKADKRGDNDGVNGDHWIQSPELSHVNHRGTPGAVNTVSEAPVSTRPTPSRAGVPKDSVIINEVFNGPGKDNDWIELRALKRTNLQNWTLSKVTARGTETQFLKFPNEARWIEAGDIWLLVPKDPNTLGVNLGAGHNVRIGQDANQAKGRGAHKYYVIDFQVPDDNSGNYLIILRTANGNDRFGSRHKIQDVVGPARFAHKTLTAATLAYEPHTGNPGQIWETEIWPLNYWTGLKAHNAGGSNNTNAYLQPDRTFAEGRAWARNGTANGFLKDGGYHAGYRGGIGYDRITSTNLAQGTPGYDNGAYKANGADATGNVIITEIMYAHDGTTQAPPQWIELFNPSSTVAVNLGNFRITITNHDQTMDADGMMVNWDRKDVAQAMLSGVSLAPKQTVLIVSARARQRQIGHRDRGFPAHRIYNAFEQNKGAFGMTLRGHAILNPYGFNIELHAKAGNAWQLSDSIGNLAARRTAGRNERADTERFDAPRWNLPNPWTEDGDRVSVARTNTIMDTTPDDMTDNMFSRVVANGKEETGWLLSSMDARTDTIDIVYYGDKEDISTPGQANRGQPLPVELSFFRPTLEDGKVTIQWTTESELDNAGFNILRSDTRNGEFTQVNEQMIQGKGTTAERSTYKWVDTTAKPGVEYYYQIEDVSFAGEHTQLATTKLKGLISAKGKLTTQWGNLKNLR